MLNWPQLSDTYFGTWLSWYEILEYDSVSHMGVDINIDDWPRCSMLSKQIKSINGLHGRFGETYRAVKSKQ